MTRFEYEKGTGRLLFTKQMKKDFTILLPMMAPIHFNIIKQVFTNYEYNVELLTTNGPELAQVGLKYVHNDTCYPAILVIGQLMAALQSGKYDTDRVALMITQTGGGCRASNYIHLLRKAMKKAGFEHVPVVSLNLSGMEKNPGFKLTVPFIRRAIAALIYGDTLMCLKNQVEPYEVNKGDGMSTVDKWSEVIVGQFNSRKGFSTKAIKRNLENIVADFASIKINKTSKVKVGIVGEIYVKYAALGNNNLESFLAQQDCEVNVPPILSFLLFKIDNRIEDIKLYGGSRIKRAIATWLMNYCIRLETIMIDGIKKSPMFIAPSAYYHTKSLIDGVIGFGNKMGEGWLLTAEMLELAESGYENIVCTQPFGCLPNHIAGKGMIRKLREINPKANIVAIDYDAGAPKVNQENRIKLMLSIAKEELNKGN